jgi:hypothetical protein
MVQTVSTRDHADPSRASGSDLRQIEGRSISEKHALGWAPGASEHAGRLNPMRTKLAVVFVGLGLSLAVTAVSLRAHHAFAAEFDANKPVTFKGTITKMEWTNPHVWLHLDVKKPDGTVEPWAFEAGTPNVLFRRGFTKTSLTPGTEVVVDGYQSKDGSRRANGRDLTFADGKKMFLGSSGTGAPYELRPGNPK